MGMHQVHHHCEPHSVCRVDEVAQVVGRAEARGRRKEIGYMIPERSVIRVFLYGHQLQGVVTQVGYFGQDRVGKFAPRAHMPVFGGHAGVRFVDQGGEVLRQAEVRIFPSEGALGEELSSEIERLRVLNHPADVSRDTVQRAVVRDDTQFYPGERGEAFPVGILVEEGFPGAAFQACERVFRGIPPVEVAHQAYRLRRGGVFTKPPAFFLRVVIEPEIAVSAGEISQAVAVLLDKAQVFVVPLQAVFQVLCIGCEPGVVAHDGQGLFSRFFFFFHLDVGFLLDESNDIFPG